MKKLFPFPGWGTDVRFFRFALPGFVLLLCLDAAPSVRAAEGVGDRTMSAVEGTTESVKEGAESLWQRIDEARLVNRTPDEIVAWVIVGLMVGGLAGMFTRLKPTGAGKAGRLVLGLAGAFIGGIIAAATELDFGWGPVLVRYEEVFFSMLGAAALIVIFRLILPRKKNS